MEKTKIIPISLRDYDLLSMLMESRYGKNEHINICFTKINGIDPSNPECENCNHRWNGHFKINDNYCPGCGMKIMDEDKRQFFKETNHDSARV